MSVRSIIDTGGGPKRLSDYALSRDRKVSEKTIYSWLQNGIPEKHWDWVAPACRVTAEQLHRANKALRESRHPHPKCVA